MFLRNLALYRCPVSLTDRLELEHALNSTGEEVLDGILLCHGCGHRFPIIHGIPHLVLDGLRSLERERNFLETWRSHLPESLYRGGLIPESESISRTPAEEALLDESEHWGRYLETFEAAGDTAILDITQKGNHPTCLELGVVEPDLRDRHRTWGLWPDHLGNRVFPRFAVNPSGRGLDLGCGGSQFGLEAARQGVDVIGTDISPGALGVAHRYARKCGYPIDFIRADIARLPLESASFDWLMCKDALHHVPHLPAVLSDIAHRLLKSGARIIIYEHCGDTRLSNWVRRKFYPWFADKIRRSYDLVESPPNVFGRDSANEKIGSNQVLEALDSLFTAEERYFENRLYHDVEGLMYYAFHRRMWVANLTRSVLLALDPLFCRISGPEFVFFAGKWEGKKGAT